MMNKYLIASSHNYCGIYRAILIDSNDELRVVIPGLHDRVPVTTSNDGVYTFDVSDYEKSKDSYPKPMWSVPNLEAQRHETPIHPCWVTFENGLSTRPVIMGWLGKGIMYHATKGELNTTPGGNPTDGGRYVGSGSTGNQNADYIFHKLIAVGVSIGGACAVLGNLAAETGETFSPTSDNGSHRGIAQWDYNTRWPIFKKWCSEHSYGGKEDTIEAQTDFLVYDLQSDSIWISHDGWNKICKTMNELNEVLDATDHMRLHYERCGEQGQEKRREKATEYWNIFKNGKIENNKYVTNNNVAKYIFIGDSRTCGMQSAAGNTNNVFICEIGAGYSKLSNWDSKIESNIVNNARVYVLMGVNDVHNVKSYITWVKNKYKSWESKNIELVYVAIMPVSSSQSSLQAECDSFNRTLERELNSSGVKYININNDIKFDYEPDGIHYKSNTYKAIYDKLTSI